MSKVILDSPENAQTGVSPGGPLVWNAAPGWDRYRLEVTERDPLLEVGEEFEENEVLINRFITDVEPVDGKISFVVDPPLSNQTEYVWRVRAARVAIIEPDPAVLGITINPSAPSVLEGETVNVVANVTVESDASKEVTWEISDDTKATIQSTGDTTATITGVSAGTPTITARSVFDNTVTGTAVLTVKVQVVPDSGELTDLNFLKAVYANLDGDNWTNRTGWDVLLASDTTLPETDVFGCEFDVRGGERRLVSFNMRNHPEGNGLSNMDANGDLIPGREFPSVGGLVCEYFNVKQNSIRGPFPDGLWTMTACKRILFAGHPREPEEGAYNHPRSSDTGKHIQGTNYFSGQLTNDGLKDMVNLEVFEGMYQGYEGELPEDFGILPKLWGLFIHNDRDDRGKTGVGWQGGYPLKWDDAPELTHIFCASPDLGPTQPAPIKGMFLRHQHSNLSGPIPEKLGLLPDIRLLLIEHNKLTGGFPTFLFTAEPGVGPSGRRKNEYLNTFDISNNDLEGLLPETIGWTFGHVAVFRLERNRFHGPLHNWLTTMKHIQFNIALNDFSGNLPSGFHDPNAPIYRRLRTFRMYGNPNLTGPLPQAGFGPKIWSVELHDCSFTGDIPEAWGHGSPTDRELDIRLMRNNLTGYEIGSDGRGCIKPLVMSGSTYVSGWRYWRGFRVDDNNINQAGIDQIILDARANVESRVGTSSARSIRISLEGNAAPSGSQAVQDALVYLAANNCHVTHS